MFRKGDIAARITTTVTHYGFGSGRAPAKHHVIEIIRVASASKDGRVKSYQTRTGSPVYKTSNRYGQEKFMTIGGDAQERATRLFVNAASTDQLRFDNQETAKAAIIAA